MLVCVYWGCRCRVQLSMCSKMETHTHAHTTLQPASIVMSWYHAHCYLPCDYWYYFVFRSNNYEKCASILMFTSSVLQWRKYWCKEVLNYILKYWCHCLTCYIKDFLYTFSDTQSNKFLITVFKHFPTLTSSFCTLTATSS